MTSMRSKLYAKAEDNSKMLFQKLDMLLRVFLYAGTTVVIIKSINVKHRVL